MATPPPDSSTIGDALREGQRRLDAARADTPRLDAEVLLRHVLGIDRAPLFASLCDPIAAQALLAYRQLLATRERGIPVAYLTGQREFMGLTFEVTPAVLIPRPETEILVEWALDWIGSRPGATVVDVGTGSGAVALSIASLTPLEIAPTIIATDISPAALDVASRNRARFGLRDRVELRLGSLLAQVTEPVDLLLANLPYLRPDQVDDNPSLAAEPRLALAGGADGLDLIRDLLQDAPRVIAPGAAIGLEIDPSQRHSVIDLATRLFPDAEISILRDLAGHDRHVIIQTP